jgi:hypothetical protein
MLISVLELRRMLSPSGSYNSTKGNNYSNLVNSRLLTSG